MRGNKMLPILTPITSSQSEIVAKTWQRRAQREAHLALRFGSLQNALRAHQATPTVLKLVEQTAQDCQRHVEAYLTVARNLTPAAQIESSLATGTACTAAVIDRRKDCLRTRSTELHRRNLDRRSFWESVRARKNTQRLS